MANAGRTPSLIALGVAALWLAFGDARVVHAAPIQYQYSGVITSAAPATGVHSGAQFTGTVTYDPAAYPSDYLGGTATYSTQPFDPPYSGRPDLTFVVGGQPIQGGTFLNVTVTDFPSPRVSFMTVGSSPSGDQFRTELEFLDPSGIDYGLYGPKAPISLANFSHGILASTKYGTSDIMFSGVITSFSATTVPEPGLASVICLAGVGWVARGRRRRPMPQR